MTIQEKVDSIMSHITNINQADWKYDPVSRAFYSELTDSKEQSLIAWIYIPPSVHNFNYRLYTPCILISETEFSIENISNLWIGLYEKHFLYLQDKDVENIDNIFNKLCK